MLTWREMLSLFVGAFVARWKNIYLVIIATMSRAKCGTTAFEHL